MTAAEMRNPPGADTQNFHVRSCHSGGGAVERLGGNARRCDYAFQHPFRLRSPVAPAVYLSGEEASEHGRMSKWLRCRGYNYPYLNSVIVLVESATRHVT